ncbi:MULTISPECIES: hypothetical protein [unclassified Streptomyces]|uniref:hypothetical protein n=1 Tax=unclassified Streptomyces TaxID=2593676 RepID=UPI00109EC4B8|nr:hypothetical protein [Streptomyces sp. A1136]THA56808.1 hypothetical protein E6R62_08655 [Streptomyces sp. A1136]
MSETERERPSAALELLALLAAGAADPAVDELGRTGDPAREAPRRSDPRDVITDGVVELRKRAAPATRPTAAGSENCLETMARRAAERAGRPRA